MGFERRLAAGFAAPTLGIALSLSLLGWLTRYEGFYAGKLAMALLACALVWLLWSRTRRTNLLIARFVASLEHRDLAQNFRSRGRGAGLDELGAAFDQALTRLRDERLAGAAEMRFAAALADEAPTPLLAVDEAGIVHLANKTARRLFREADSRHATQFGTYGADFARALATASTGERLTCRVRWNGLSQRAVIAVALVHRQGRPWRIVSVQIIQNELDAAEMATQTDLVRVLTHEIMNSLTPITSLADSTSRLLATLDPHDDAGVADARTAVAALARRASGIAHFVDSYRSFSETPSVTIERFRVRAWVDELVRSFAATPQAMDIPLRVVLGSDELQIDGDADLLGQIVLNLLKNAAQAVGGSPDAQIELRIIENDAGRIELRVSDNGPGIPRGLEDEIFLPFFTTKPDGSGIGLSLAKQIVLLHGGEIGVVPSSLNGAAIQIVLR